MVEVAAEVLRRVQATRYVEPLREGGSLPALVEADDDGLYVVKFRGAGQGPKALIAELVAGALARAAGLPVPELAFVELDPAARLEARDTGGERLGAHEDVAALVLGEEAEALLDVVPLHLARWHCGSSSFSSGPSGPWRA